MTVTDVGAEVLVDGRVDVWAYEASTIDEHAGEHLLSADELAYTARLRSEPHRRRFCQRRIGLRYVVALYNDLRSMQLRRLPCITCKLEHGQPFLVSPQTGQHVCVSTSSAGEMSVIALGRTPALGVDVEPLTAASIIRRASRLVLSDAERSSIERMDDREQDHAFVKTWTLKESYLKAIGRGLFEHPRAVEVELRSTGSRVRPAESRDSRPLCCETNLVEDRYVVAVTSIGSSRIRYRWLDASSRLRSAHLPLGSLR